VTARLNAGRRNWVTWGAHHKTTWCLKCRNYRNCRAPRDGGPYICLPCFVSARWRP
jgi:hypothetical protein